MAKYGLASRFRTGAYAGLTAVAMGLGAAIGCGGDGPVKPIDKKPRIVSSYLGPMSGTAPVEETATLLCEDDHAIADYTLIKGADTVVTKSSIDTTFILNDSTYITRKCRDDAGQEAVDGPKLVAVSRPVEPLEQIAFWSDRDAGTGELYVGDLIKTAAGRDTLVNIKRITNNSVNDIWPAWSPDGKYLIWSANRATPDGWFALYRVNPKGTDGDDEIRLTPSINDFSAYSPIWCSNDWIYFNFRDGNTGTQGTARIGADGTGLEKVIEEPFNNKLSGRPACSPNGSNIAYVSFLDGNADIYVADSIGNNKREITKDPSDDILPIWSPNGLDIVFVSWRDGTSNLYQYTLKEGDLKKLTNNTGSNTDPNFFPNGKDLIFVHDLVSFFNPQIYIVNSDGTGNWTQLTFDGANRYPAIRPAPK